MSDEKQAANPSLPSGLRVLVVNVRPVQARLVVEQLTGWGAAGEVVSDINQALIQLQDAAAIGKPYRVAIVDLPIGVFGAAEFGQIISHSVGARRTRYILSTTPDHALTPRQLADSVFCASIVKPLTQAKLADALAPALTGDGKPSSPRPSETMSTAAADPLPPIDAGQLVKRCDDDVNALAGMLGTFQSRAIGDVEQMIQGLRARDAAQVARSAHALKDAATSLTASGVRDAAASIERFGSVADFDGAHWAVQRLQSELERLRDFVRDQARSGKV